MVISFLRPRRALMAALLYGSAALAAAAESPSASPAASSSPAQPELTIEAAQRLALERQPLLTAQQALVTAARESAVADAQLPDPSLSVGLQDLPINSDDAYSLQRDSDTQIQLGLSQAVPARAKRQLLGERGRREAEMAAGELELKRREIRRDTALAWVEVFKPERARLLAQAVVHEAELGQEAARIAYTAGRSSQAELLAAGVALEQFREQVAGLRQDAAHARNALSRWIGPAAAQQPLPAEWPDWSEPPAYAVIVERLAAHPHLDSLARQVNVARTDVDLARQDYRPDWNWELGYGYRPGFSEMVMVKVGMDLPWFTGKRQDRRLAARVAELERTQALRDDSLRQHEAELRLNYADWQLLGQRLKTYDELLLPQSAARIEAAQLAYQAGTGTLGAVLDARRAELEIRLQRLDLETDRAKHRAQLHYLAGDEHE